MILQMTPCCSERPYGKNIIYWHHVLSLETRLLSFNWGKGRQFRNIILVQTGFSWWGAGGGGLLKDMVPFPISSERYDYEYNSLIHRCRISLLLGALHTGVFESTLISPKIKI